MLDANLPAVSKLEQKSDVELSSLGPHIKAMVRKLETVAFLKTMSPSPTSPRSVRKQNSL